jgi:hypothetical protein
MVLPLSTTWYTYHVKVFYITNYCYYFYWCFIYNCLYCIMYMLRIYIVYYVFLRFSVYFYTHTYVYIYIYIYITFGALNNIFESCYGTYISYYVHVIIIIVFSLNVNGAITFIQFLHLVCCGLKSCYFFLQNVSPSALTCCAHKHCPSARWAYTANVSLVTDLNISPIVAVTLSYNSIYKLVNNICPNPPCSCVLSFQVSEFFVYPWSFFVCSLILHRSVYFLQMLACTLSPSRWEALQVMDVSTITLTVRITIYKVPS